MAKIIGGTTTTPIQMPNMDGYATKEYVDTNTMPMPTGTGYGNYVVTYNVTESGKQGKINTSMKYAGTAVDGTLVQRMSGGTINVGNPTADSHATTKKYVDDALAALPSGGGETWVLIRDDTLTEDTLVYECSTDSGGNPLNLKKLKVIITLDTTQGVYTDGTITCNVDYTGGGSFARAIYANKPLPTTAGRFGVAVFDGEVLGGKLYCQVVFTNNRSNLKATEMGDPFTIYGNVGFPISTEFVEQLNLRIGNGQNFHIGTRFIVYGVRA